MKDPKDCKTEALLVFTHNVDSENPESENFVVQQIVFKTQNSMHRFGEFLAIMTGSDAFDTYEIKGTDDETPVLLRVVLEPYEEEHPFTQNIEEDLDQDPSVVDSTESDN